MELLGVMLLGAILNGLLASSRGRHPAGWALLGVCIPLISLLILVLMPNLKEDQQSSQLVAASQAREIEAQRAAAEADHRRRMAEKAAQVQADTRECPYCAETIKAAAKICRFCGHEVAPLPGSGRSVRPAVAVIDVRPHQPDHGSITVSPTPISSAGTYRGVRYDLHEDYSVSSVVEGTRYAWRSLHHFRTWVDSGQAA